MLSTVAPFLLLLSGLSLADSKPLKLADGEKSPSSPDFKVGSMNLPQQPFVAPNSALHNPHHRPSRDTEHSFYDSIVLNGDFLTGDTSGWSVESPAEADKWMAKVAKSSAKATSGSARSALKVTVPENSYVMMFQDIDYNSTSTFVLPSTSTEGAHTTARTIPFQKSDPYVLNFDYRFDSACAAGSSLYYGVVSSEDLVDLEGDLEKSTLSIGAVEGWTSFHGKVKASTEWGSLYLYFMTKEKGGCTFEFADVGLWRVVADGEGQTLDREL